MAERTGRPTWAPRLVTLLLAPLACYLAYQLGLAFGPAQQSGSAEPKPIVTRLGSGLEIAAADLDLGEVWEDPDFVRSVTITNRGDRSAMVLDLSGGCECTAIAPRSFTLRHGESQQIQVRIDLTHRFPHQFGADRRELALNLHPVLKESGVSAGAWTITGVIQSRVSLESRGVAFGDLCGQGGPPVTRKMRATAHVPLAGLEATLTPENGTATVHPVADQPNRYDIRVTPNPSLPRGPFRFPVALTAVLSDGRRVRCASFTVDGEMGSPARVVPDPVLLGEHLVGCTANAVVTVQFPTPGWVVDRVEAEHSDTMVTPTDPLNGRPTYCIAQPITKPGDQVCQMRVVARHPGGRIESLTATVLWHGSQRKDD